MFGKYFARSTLKARAMKGGVAALGGFGAAQAIRLASNLIMTRLLAPDAFGLMGVTIALQVWIAMMSDLGLNQSIIRSKIGDDPDYLATARLMQLGRCVLMATILVIAALALPGLASNGVLRAGSVYADPRLPVFLYCIAASVTISGFSAMRVALHNRSLDIVPVIRLELSAQIVALFSMAAAAVAGLGVYSLALGAIVAEAVKTVGSHFALKGPPARFAFHRQHFREIFTYGKWLVIASTFGFLVQRGDQIVFGWLLDTRDYSLYSIATLWVLTGRATVETVQRRIAAPALAEVQRDRAHDLTRIYARLRLVYEILCISIFLGVVAFAGPFISLIYSDAYAGVAHYMRLLALMLLFVPYYLLSAVILNGGDSRRFATVTVVPGAALFAGTPVIFHHFGADAAIVFAASTPMLALPFYWKYASKFIRIDYARESLLAAATVAAAILLLNFT